MVPVLYAANETAFTTQGIGALSDIMACRVTEERNGAYTLDFTYPITGAHYADILLRNIVLAKPNTTDQPQPFRINHITRPIGGVVTVSAQHISYDLSGIVVRPFVANGLANAIVMMDSHSVGTNPFTLTTDKVSSSVFTLNTPQTYRATLGGTEGSLLQVYRGEYKFDRFSIQLLTNRGEDRGVLMTYGKNISNIQQDENNAATYTGVYPYWYSEDDGLVTASPEVVPALGTYDYERIMPLDLTQEFDEKPTAAQLKARAESYVVDNDVGVPAVSMSVSWQQVGNVLDDIRLCDTVHIEFPQLNVSAAASVITTVYDVLLERFESIQIGDPKSNFAETVAKQYERIESVDNYVTERNVTYLKQITDTATESRTAIQQIAGDGPYYSMTELSQTSDEVSATVGDMDSRVDAVITDTDALLQFMSETEGKMVVLGYVRAVQTDGGQLAVVVGDTDETHTKLKLVQDKLLFSTTADEDDDLSNAQAYFSNQQLFVRQANVIDYLQIGTDGNETDWMWLREDDGDLILKLV